MKIRHTHLYKKKITLPNAIVKKPHNYRSFTIIMNNLQYNSELFTVIKKAIDGSARPSTITSKICYGFVLIKTRRYYFHEKNI